MNKKLRWLLSAALLAVFVFSTAYLVRYLIHRQQNQVSQELAMEIAFGSTAPDDPEIPQSQPPASEATQATQITESTEPAPQPVWIPAPFQADPAHMAVLEAIDLSALQQVNPDVIGWIYIPDTGIHFPLLQGLDNTYYLEHSWDGRENLLGSIYMECRNDPGFTDFNTILYGHNIVGGEMFAPLHNYASEDYRRSHPYIYILTQEGIFRYEIFASYLADVDSPTYGLSFNQAATRENFLDFALESSQISTGIHPNLTDRFLTLSTCTGRGYEQRRVVVARMEMLLQN